jgi:5-methylcytosine-specific restriction protein A
MSQTRRRAVRRIGLPDETMLDNQPQGRDSWHHLYSTPRWRAMRAAQLAEFPLCWYCEQAGRTTAADTVDHVIPHRGDEALFWDQLNLRSACPTCHNAAGHQRDLYGYTPGAGLDGEPLDPGHPWARGARA